MLKCTKGGGKGLLEERWKSYFIILFIENGISYIQNSVKKILMEKFKTK